jgi:outer membrane protein OmpA-like peptidoglycan-associated protein
MKKIILSTLTCATILLANNTPKYEISPMFGKAVAHDRLNLKDDKSVGLTVSIKDEYTMFDQLELAWFNTSGVDFDKVIGDTNVNRFLLSGIKNYELTDKSSLYALAGFGYEKFKSEAIHADSSAVVNLGVGFKYSITKSIALKAEFRRVCRELRESSHLYHLGLSIPFGDNSNQLSLTQNNNNLKKEDVNSMVSDSNNKNKSNTSIEMNKKVTAHFDSDKAEIKQDDKILIKKYVDYLKKFPSARIVVEGHTDATASEAYNKSLAARRAMNVKAYMVDLGIDASRIRVESYGETMPVIDNKTKAHRAMNRRVVSKIIR